MSDRAKELWEDFQRYLREALTEWWDSVDDSLPSHVYTAILTIILWQIVKWAVN